MNTRPRSALLAISLAIALIAAACAPEGPTLTPGATNPVITDPLATEPLATEPLATEPLATEPVPATEAVTPGLTAEALTPQASPEATTAPDMAGEPSVFLSSELIGSQVVDTQAEIVGNVIDILVDEAGAVQYVVVDAMFYVGDAAPAATPDALASPNPAAMNAGIVAVPLSAFEIMTMKTTEGEQADERQVLVYTGTAADLEALGTFDLAAFDEPGFVINTIGTTLDASFDGLIRASEATRASLETPAGERLGNIGNLIIDVTQQAVQFSVVEVGGFLGIGAQQVAIPWEHLIIDETGAMPEFHLNTDVQTLESAPRLDLGAWPAWLERVENNTEWNLRWQDEIRNFWAGVASS